SQAPLLPGSRNAGRLADSIPANREDEVAADTTVALRFTKPVRPSSVSATNVQVVGPLGAEPAEVVMAEGGRMAFVHPAEDLLSGAEYHVTVSQTVDADGVPIPDASFTFTTALRPTETHAGAGTGPFGRHTGHHGHGQYDLTPPGQPAERDEWEWRGERRN